MPFYVDYSLKSRTVYLKNVSEDQLIICEKLHNTEPGGYLIFLEAFLNDTFNNRNVEFLWEQIKGNPVVLNNDTTTIASYPYIDTTDKTFRFWIDKDTANERYMDTKVSHTPFSNSISGFNNENPNNHSATIYNISSVPGVKTTGYSRTFLGRVLGLPANIYSYLLGFESSLAPFAIKMEVYHSVDATHNPDTLIDTFYPPYPIEYSAIIGFLKFKFYYNINGQEVYYWSELLVSLNNGLLDDSNHTSDDVVPTPGFMVSTKVLIRYVNTRFSVPVDNLSGAGGYNSSNVSSTRFSNISRYFEDIEVINTAGYNIGRTIKLTRYDPSGIGHSA